MAIFSNKIISVRFFDAKQTIIEVLYKEGDQTVAYALEVDWESQDFHDLLEEYSLEDIERASIKRRKEKIEKRKKEQKPVEKKIIYETSQLFNCLNFLDQRFDPGIVFQIKADIFRIRGMTQLPKSKINKIKKSNDALELMYLLKLAMN